MSHPELNYLHLLRDILNDGDPRTDRTGVGTRALLGRELRFDLADGFPLLTTKRVSWKTAFREMLWMLAGGTNIRELLAHNVHIWSDWPHQKYVSETGEDISLEDFEQRVMSDEDFAARWGELGPVYGKQWRRWLAADGREIDQVSGVIEMLRSNPSSRRILWTGWNVGELEQMALPPCHKDYQFFVHHATNRLCSHMAMRSVDTFLGLPFNIANLALVTMLMAQQTGYAPGEIVVYGVDCHIYNNHRKQVFEQMMRDPRPWPHLVIRRKPDSLFDYRMEDFDVEGYDPYPAIKAPVAV